MQNRSWLLSSAHQSNEILFNMRDHNNDQNFQLILRERTDHKQRRLLGDSPVQSSKSGTYRRFEGSYFQLMYVKFYSHTRFLPSSSLKSAANKYGLKFYLIFYARRFFSSATVPLTLTSFRRVILTLTNA